MSNALISVIMPIYNSRKFLADAVRSITRCNYENLEIILVDDGSTDGSGRICDRFAEFDKRVKVIHKENEGVSAARNAGLEIATGDWIAFCDSDDKIEPQIFNFLIKKAEKYSADIVQCGIIIEKDDELKKTFTPPCDIVLRTCDKALEKHFLKLFPYSCFAKLFKKSVIDEIRFDKRWIIGEDLRFCLDALSDSYRIVFTTRALYRYRQHADSITHKNDSETLTAFDDMIKASAVDFKNSKSLSKITKRIMLLNYADMCSRIVLNDIPDSESVFEGIRKELQRKILYILLVSRLPKKEKRKLLLIAFMPKLYKKLLLSLKPSTYTEEAAADATPPAEEKALPTEKARPEDIRLESDEVYVSNPPKSTEEIQSHVLDLLKHLRDVCDKNNLAYYLAAGTLIGAVRHNGFIPWDDDADVFLTRKDYRKLLKVLRKEESDDFFVQDEKTECGYPFAFAKLKKSGTEIAEELLSNSDIRGGVFVDIFPLDRCPLNEARAERYFKITLFIQSALMARTSPDFVCGYEKKCAKVAFKIARSLPSPLLTFSRNTVIAYYTLTSKKGRLCVLGGSYGYRRECFDEEWFSEKLTVDFESEKFTAPKAFHQILTNTYGDYMTPPSDSERKGHFAIK